ncbi:uncharacterized protein LOC123297749 [Chrysoperla carnea]|uniref:uncharacterized protein LOC123297749 n=1 Tax=Chrysoperla carnea TaxID=189513 RepID=UPI001D089401|nr:uncharacterized protein LOC123297749 [Chrysoperla carnea]
MIELCSRCNSHVFSFNRKYALGRIWHRHCFSCNRCNKQLSDCSVAFHNGQLLCRDCYSFHEFPPACIKPKEPLQKRCEVCNCRSVCSRNGRTCQRCSRFKTLMEDDESKSNQCSKSNFCDKKTSTVSTITFCPTANSTMNKATSTCSIPNNQSPTTSNIFKFLNNDPCSSKTNQKASTGCCTLKSAHISRNESFPLNKKPSPCQQKPFQYLYTSKKTCPEFSSTLKGPPENCPPRSKCNVTQNLSSSCCQEPSSRFPEEKSCPTWIPKFPTNSLPKDSQRNKFVILALPILGEMEM